MFGIDVSFAIEPNWADVVIAVMSVLTAVGTIILAVGAVLAYRGVQRQIRELEASREATLRPYVHLSGNPAGRVTIGSGLGGVSGVTPAIAWTVSNAGPGAAIDLDAIGFDRPFTRDMTALLDDLDLEDYEFEGMLVGTLPAGETNQFFMRIRDGPIEPSSAAVRVQSLERLFVVYRFTDLFDKRRTTHEFVPIVGGEDLVARFPSPETSSQD